MEKACEKIVIYQVLPRLFGNTCLQRIPWGTKEQNGIGKFSDFNDIALQAIKDLGITHLWLTGVLHHALIGDYKAYGISDDDPDVVKGRAGSPYAVKDYFSVDPDLSDHPDRRNEEFRDLIDRIHRHGMKVIMDIIPNHVARGYQSRLKPDEIRDFGQDDNRHTDYSRDNNFYYLPDERFELPDWPDGYKPLGGEEHPLADHFFDEMPAKWTGNDCRKAKPEFTDWYETVKLNYGVRPDGSWDFDPIPSGFEQLTLRDQSRFWENRSVPDTWKKMREIVRFWLGFGVDGFRYDMAEMIPLPFWNFLHASIKVEFPEILTIAEIYQPEKYRDFIRLGHMDFLYDKVGLYDTLRDIITGIQDCHAVFPTFDPLYDISSHLLHFMENHDEHRIASPEFAGNPDAAKPAMVLSACLGPGALMIYNGQEVGEPALENAGFGGPGRTSIYDYTSIPKHQQWMDGGSFAGKQLSESDTDLRNFYKNLILFCTQTPALRGGYYDLHRHNASLGADFPGSKLYGFARWVDDDKWIILANFSSHNSYSFRFYVYFDLIGIWNLQEGVYTLKDHFTHRQFSLKVEKNLAFIDVKIEPLESLLLQLTEKNT